MQKNLEEINFNNTDDLERVITFMNFHKMKKISLSIPLREVDCESFRRFLECCRNIKEFKMFIPENPVINVLLKLTNTMANCCPLLKSLTMEYRDVVPEHSFINDFVKQHMKNFSRLETFKTDFFYRFGRFFKFTVE